MSVKAACNHDTKVVTLHVWDAERGRAFTEETIAIPFSEVRKAICALVGVYGFIDPADARKLFKGDELREPVDSEQKP